MLKDFLEKKPLFYDKIDYTRMPRVYKKIEKHLVIPKIIHMIGTNGKGTTGRFLASALYKAGYKTGHYTSPHILNFNERIWLNATLLDDNILEENHILLLKILDTEDAKSLSYFEYTTLLAILIYKDCDFIVLEAGLGGEHDATAVFPKILTLVTPIDKDHEAFLGDTILQIATTKLKVVQNYAIVANQIYADVEDVMKTLSNHNKVKFFEKDNFLYEKDKELVKDFSKRMGLALYLQENLSLAIAALNYLNIKYTYDSFENGQLFGRLSQISKNVLVDVGHNTLAAKKIVESVKKKKYILIYNSYSDKNYKEILEIMTPIIEEVQILSVEEKRIEKKEILEETIRDLQIPYTTFKSIVKEKNYLVFGSFSVVETFLKGFIE